MSIGVRWLGPIAVAAGAIVLLPLHAPTAEEATPTALHKQVIDAAGTIHVPAFAVPFSSLASEEARARFLEQIPAINSSGGIDLDAWFAPDKLLETRKASDEARRKIVEQMRARFPVEVTSERIGGVQTDVVVPKAGVALKNAERVLINLHGGGFVFGAHWEGLVASIPIASLGKIKVITVDYRMAPEYRFPAASEDVASVYRDLLKQYRPEAIGIYGCSAGGMLTAQAVAWFRTHGLPRPGAVGIFCAGAMAAVMGDALYTGSVLSGVRAPIVPSPRRGLDSILNPYFGDSDVKDPLASPVFSTSTLSEFPPTLLITGTRDHSMSSVVYTHSQLIKAGVEADLHVWEGMGHAFSYDHELPESRESFDVTVKFFDKHLGKK